jgi:O-antigen/teichoic acid export membrane protein
MMIYAFLGGVLAANLPDSMYYFVPKYTGAQRKIVVGQTGILLFCLAIVTCGVMFIFAPQFASSMHNPELEAFLQVVSLFPLSQLLIKLVGPVLISLDKAWPAAVFTIITNVVRVVSVGAPIILGRDLVFAGYCLVISSAVMAVFGMATLFFHSRCVAFGWNNILLREQLSYVVPLAAAGLAGIIGRTLDKFIISFFFEPGEYAAYANGAIELPLIGILTTSLSAAIMPDLVRYGKEGKFSEILQLWNTATRKCALIIFPVFVLVLIVSSDIIIMLFTDKYTDSVYSFRVYLFVAGHSIRGARRFDTQLYREHYVSGVRKGLVVVLRWASGRYCCGGMGG